MNISEATNAFKVGEFLLRDDNNPNKIKIKYLDEGEIDQNILNDSSGRVYLIVSNQEIMKIGGSMSKGGIKATLSFYISAMQGGPSQRSWCIHLLIEKELRKNNKVECWMIKNEKVDAQISGLKTTLTQKVAAFKESEDLCKKEYKEINNKFPPWNFQENHEEYPKDLTNLHREHMSSRALR
tara:strand:- start:320 stop:865 length:546 start_codon:yes stop_codon:yes gene_type:complete